jgi:hypothetical protein
MVDKVKARFHRGLEIIAPYEATWYISAVL